MDRLLSRRKTTLQNFNIGFSRLYIKNKFCLVISNQLYLYFNSATFHESRYPIKMQIFVFQSEIYLVVLFLNIIYLSVSFPVKMIKMS